MSTTVIHAALTLPGCQPSPLLSYLKSLGILRLVAEQVDPAAAGRWSARGFVLTSLLDRGGLGQFLLEGYRPTPIVAPWNGRSGFFAKNYDRDSERLVARLARTPDRRLADLREAIAVGFKLHEDGPAHGWIAPNAKGKLEVVDKDACIAYCRNRLPDAAVPWIDAVAALAEGGPAYSVLLGGSGGNLGSLDLSGNWYQHLVGLLLDDRPPRAARLLADALDGSASEPSAKAKIGQLDPGRAGGVGRQRGDDGGSAATWVNPWDLVLALEGALLFASAVARRSGRQGARGRAALPFTVAGSATGAKGGVASETVRGELWLPLWSAFATLPELTRLFGEGRVQWDARQAETSTDAASAIVSLGSDRGIDAFDRVAVVQRLGQASLAVPVGRFAVAERPEVRLIVDFDRWLRRVEREVARPPGSILSALRRARRTQWELTQRGGALRLSTFLTAVAEVESAIARSAGAQARIPPATGPGADTLAPALSDGTAEMAVALALASLRDPAPRRLEGPGDQTPTDRVRTSHSLRACLTPVRLRAGRWEWTNDKPAPVEGLGRRRLADVLAEVLAFRSRKTSDDGGAAAGIVLRGVAPWFVFGWPVPGHLAAALAAGGLDHARVARLLAGLLLLDWEYAAPPQSGLLTDAPSAAVWVAAIPVAPAQGLLAPFFSPRPVQLRASGATSAHTDVRLRPEAGWARLLASDRAADVVRAALRRLRTAGLAPALGVHNVAGRPASGAMRGGDLSVTAGIRGPDVAAAVLVHLRPADYRCALTCTIVRPSTPIGEEPPDDRDP